MALKPFLAHELQQLSMLATRRTFQDFLENKNTSEIKYPSEQLRRDQDLSYPMLLRTHILPGLAKDCVRDVAPQKAMKMEKSRRSFILMQDAWLLGS